MKGIPPKKTYKTPAKKAAAETKASRAKLGRAAHKKKIKANGEAAKKSTMKESLKKSARKAVAKGRKFVKSVRLPGSMDKAGNPLKKALKKY
jgi:hypothetical protein